MPSRAGLPPYIGRSREQLLAELTEIRARGWALADEELAPGVRSVAVPVRDGTGGVRAAMNVTVHAAETPTDVLLGEYLPHLLRTAGEVSADWALWQSRPHVELVRAAPRRDGRRERLTARISRPAPVSRPRRSPGARG